MDDLMTSAEAARHYRVSTRRLRAIAQARGISGRLFGQQRVFTAEDVEALRPGQRGVRRKENSRTLRNVPANA